MPFRPDLKHGQCIICGRFMRAISARMQGEPEDSPLCDCPMAHNCEGCINDNLARAKSKGLVKPHFACKIHKDFKSYQECLLNYKNWCIVACTFFSIPLCLFCWAVNLNLTWTYYFTGILIASSVVPIALSILWARATSHGMIAGTLLNCFDVNKITQPLSFKRRYRRLRGWNDCVAQLRFSVPGRPFSRNFCQKYRRRIPYVGRQHFCYCCRRHCR